PALADIPEGDRSVPAPRRQRAVVGAQREIEGEWRLAGVARERRAEPRRACGFEQYLPVLKRRRELLAVPAQSDADDRFRHARRARPHRTDMTIGRSHDEHISTLRARGQRLAIVRGTEIEEQAPGAD